jgi:hypothetical protein
MRLALPILFVCTLGLISCQSTVSDPTSSLSEEASETIPGEYIIVLNDSKSLNHQQKVIVAQYSEHSVNDLCRSGQRFSTIVLDVRISPNFAEPFKKRILLPNLRDLNELGMELDAAVEAWMLEICCADRHIWFCPNHPSR